MMLSTTRPNQRAVYSLLLLATIWILYMARNSVFDAVLQYTPESTRLLSGRRFVERAFKTTFEDEFDPSAIQSLCRRIQWRNDLVFTCKSIRGGVGNVRNELLGCLRFAMEAGAGFVVPILIVRSPTDVNEISFGDKLDMDYLFSQSLFVSRLRTSCPQMPLFEKLEDLHATGAIPVSIPLQVDSLTHGKEHGNLGNIWEWRATFQKWLATQIDLKEATEENKIAMIELDAIMAYFPVCSDPMEFITSFGDLLVFREDSHRLAAVALYNLARQYGLPIKPSDKIHPSSYLGVHLRTSKDATALGWTPYEAQKNRYINLIISTTLSLVYVASGNAADIARFAQEIQPAAVTTKHNLLTGKDLDLLQQMTWDQQALVDYLVLSRASNFGGMGFSSFSWNVAVRRRLLSDAETCRDWRPIEAPWKMPDMTVFKDNLSDIIGDTADTPNFSYGFWP